jgi:NitT/TauT family transport system permease protein
MLALWKLVSAGIGAEIILPAPERVVSTLLGILFTPRFALALGATALRGLAAFTVSMVLGIALGMATGASARARTLTAPMLTVVRATPVLAVILLAMIWFPSGVVPVFSAVVMAFPVVAADVAAGVRSADPRLLAMARSFGVSKHDTLMGIRVPSALPHVLSAARNAIGLSWKVIVAGEVLSQPAHAVGTGMQNARIMLETAEVFAWAAVGIALCAISDAVFEAIARRMAWPLK